MKRTAWCFGLWILLIPTVAQGSDYQCATSTLAQVRPTLGESVSRPIRLGSADNAIASCFTPLSPIRRFATAPPTVESDSGATLLKMVVIQPAAAHPSVPYQPTADPSLFWYERGSSMFIVQAGDLSYSTAANVVIVGHDGWEYIIANVPARLLTEQTMIGPDRLNLAGVRYGQDGWFMEGTVTDVREFLVQLENYANRAVGATLGGGFKLRGHHAVFTTGFGLGPFRVFTLDLTGRWRTGVTAYGAFTWRF